MCPFVSWLPVIMVQDDIIQNGSFASCDLLQLVPTPMKIKNIDPKRCTDRNISWKSYGNLNQKSTKWNRWCTEDRNFHANSYGILMNNSDPGTAWDLCSVFSLECVEWVVGSGWAGASHMKQKTHSEECQSLTDLAILSLCSLIVSIRILIMYLYTVEGWTSMRIA